VPRTSLSLTAQPIRHRHLGALFLALAALGGCGSAATLPVSAGMGPHPQLPEPKKSLIPTVNVADAKGWHGDAKPTPAAGLRVNAFAAGLEHPRWLYVLPNGDVLVAETNAPVRPEDGKGIKGFFFKKFQQKAGGGVPSANRITLLRDADGDGVAEVRTTFVAGLTSPFGMALVGNTLYIANADAIVSVPYTTGVTQVTAAPKKLVDLPGGPINHHWTKNIIASVDGTKLYASIGSNSNITENGIEVEADRAQIWEIDLRTGAHRVFATGLRNPVGMTWQPESGALWVAVNERDELGSDMVPDYMTSVRDGAFYGWPYSYYGQHVDDRVKVPRPDLVARATVPDYALGPHTASLGLTSSKGSALGPAFIDGMFVGQHGSWNREPASGYKVIFVPFTAGMPSGAAVDVLTEFLDRVGNAQGRPVGVAIDGRGALLVADDVGNTIWRVTAGAH
jgi:glucose/arabinose dehydrogenase